MTRRSQAHRHLSDLDRPAVTVSWTLFIAAASLAFAAWFVLGLFIVAFGR